MTSPQKLERTGRTVIDEATACRLTGRFVDEPSESLQARRATAGKFSTTFFVTGADEDYVLRIAPPDDMLLLFYERRMMRQEPAIHRLVQKRTDALIPTILGRDFSRERIDRDYLVMRRLAGEPLSEIGGSLTPADTHAVLHELGRQVAMLHGIRAKRHGYIGAHRPMEPQPGWPDAFAVMWERMFEGTADCGIFNREDCRLGLRLWREYESCFDPATPAVLGHMDLWVANVMVHNGRFAGLFDFDRACFGDRENDLAVAEYCGLIRRPFIDGYLACQTGPASWPEPSREWAVRRWFYLLYEHQKYIVISMSARHDNPQRARRYANDCRQSMRAFADTGRPEF